MLRSTRPAFGCAGPLAAAPARPVLHAGKATVRRCRAAPARAGRAACVRVSAFKDWFNTFVVSPKEQPVAVPAQQHAPSPKQPAKRDFLEARQVSIYQLFDSDEYRFNIPPYQRPYSWRTKQVFELLQDFLHAYHGKHECFLGAIVATKTEDGTAQPYQLIDGQQRLTTLVILLSFLHSTAKEQQNEVLEQRIKRMLYLEADPLDPNSTGRYRLKLRDADDGFFQQNVLDAFLPTKFRLSGVVAAAQSTAMAAPAPPPPAVAGTTLAQQLDEAAVAAATAAVAALEQQQGQAGEAALENETWWRLYENAAFLKQQLDHLVAGGLNLQDFTFHCLRNCYIVVMVARDESSSFRIFSTLNGRGMDLSVVDKLKADLLQVLSPSERTTFSEAWAEMENVLGRSAFHRVFDYMRDLAAVSDPWVADTAVLEYFTRKVDDPMAVKQIMTVALEYSRILLQLRQADWAASQPSAPLDAAAAVPSPAVAAAAASAAAQGLLAEAGTAAADGIIASPILLQEPLAAGQGERHAALLAEMATASHCLNLFTDEAWLPPFLEFSYQEESLEHRLAFMKGAEALQLYLELEGDAALKAARWGAVSTTLLSRPFSPEGVLASLALSTAERAAFRQRLDSKDLHSSTEQRTLTHLLLRCEPAHVLDRCAAGGVSAFHVEKVAPQHAPEGSLWRKTRTVSTSNPAAPWPPAWFEAQSASAEQQPEVAAAASAGGDVPDAVAVPAAEEEVQQQEDVAPVKEAGQQLYEVKYWYEVQRMFWHAKLGNLVLLPAKTAGSGSGHGAATADYEGRAALWRQAGVASALPGFSGPLVAEGGRYSRFRFAFDECRVRHADMLGRLVEVFEL